MADRAGLAHPGAVPVLANAVIASAQHGDLPTARRLLAVLDTQQIGLATLRTTAMWHHARGVVTLAEGGGDGCVAALERAFAAFDEMGLGTDAARVLLALGQAHARDGRRSDAAASVAEAQRRFSAMGAAQWAQRCAEERSRIVPGSRIGSLTGTQRRIADLVTAGRKNREIAAELFISVTTVEGHLTRIYRDLGIRSRTDLALLVAEGALDGEVEP